MLKKFLYMALLGAAMTSCSENLMDEINKDESNPPASSVNAKFQITDNRRNRRNRLFDLGRCLRMVCGIFHRTDIRNRQQPAHESRTTHALRNSCKLDLQ